MLPSSQVEKENSIDIQNSQALIYLLHSFEYFKVLILRSANHLTLKKFGK